MTLADLQRQATRAGQPRPLRAGWKSLVLVCKACEKRRKAPRRLAAKALATAVRGACRDACLPRPRVVLTSCMGACPKKAFTVAAVRPGCVVMLAVERGDDAAAAVQTLFGPYSNSTSSTPSAT